MSELFLHIDVWCFSLQNWQVLVLRRYEALYFDPVQLKHNFFSESFSLRSDTFARLMPLLLAIDTAADSFFSLFREVNIIPFRVFFTCNYLWIFLNASTSSQNPQLSQIMKRKILNTNYIYSQGLF